MFRMLKLTHPFFEPPLTVERQGVFANHRDKPCTNRPPSPNSYYVFLQNFVDFSNRGIMHDYQIIGI